MRDSAFVIIFDWINRGGIITVNKIYALKFEILDLGVKIFMKQGVNLKSKILNLF